MKTFLVVIAAVLICAAQRAGSTTIRVPEDQPTVIAALDLAFAGDSVLVGPGTWTARQTRTIVLIGGPSPVRANGFLRAGVSLIGTHGAEATVLEADTEANTGVLLHMLVRQDQPQPGTITVQGLTLRGRGQYHRLWTSDDCDVLFEDCVLENLGYGINIRRGAITVRRSVFRNNDATGFAAQVVGVEQFEGPVLVEDCLFESNGGAFIFDISNPALYPVYVRRNIFRGNSASPILANYVLPVEIQDNLFEGNHPTLAGPLVQVANAVGVISGNTFWGNSPGNSIAGTLVSTGQDMDIVGNTFVDNDVGGRAALFTRDDAPFHVRRNVFVGTTNGWAYRNFGPYVPTDGCNVFWDNPGGNYTGYTAQPTDRIADPLFCDRITGDFTLREGSPCLPGIIPACGQIGAWGLGCGVVSVEPTTWGRIKNFYREGDAR